MAEDESSRKGIFFAIPPKCIKTTLVNPFAKRPPLKNILLAQIDVAPGRPDLNFKKIAEWIGKAKERGAELVIFPEMAVPGYLIGDRFESDAFLRDVAAYDAEIRDLSRGLTVVWGSVWTDFSQSGEDGRSRKYNAALIATDGKWLSNGVFEGRTYKTLLPKYREFDDARHFYSLINLARDQGQKLEKLLRPFPIVLNGKKRLVGLILCEDMWHGDYSDNPAKILLAHGAGLIVNLSASPWTWRKNDKRHRVVKELMAGSKVPFLYCNNVGTQNNGKNIFLFDGNSTVYGPGGERLASAGDYQEEFLEAGFPVGNRAPLPDETLSPANDTAALHAGLVHGIRQFFTARNSKKALIGLSGGIDSALVATLLTEALGPDNIFAVNMPTRFNSQCTRDNAKKLAANLGISYAIVPIENLFESTASLIGQAVFTRLDGSSTQTRIALTPLIAENIQARHRGATVLSALAAALGAVYTNNGNKTETALGYATLYGDVNGAIAPIADLYKGEVYALANHLNQVAGRELIPEGIFSVVPSAELSPEQNVDQGKGDPIVYPYHDKLVRAFVEFRKEPEDILKLYFMGQLEEKLHVPAGTIAKHFPKAEDFILDLEHKWRLFNLSVFKRIQAPPIIAVSKRAFGFDLRESQNGEHFTRTYQKLKDLVTTGEIIKAKQEWERLANESVGVGVPRPK